MCSHEFQQVDGAPPMLFQIIVVVVMAAIVHTAFVSHEVCRDFIESPIITIAT